MDSHDFTDRNLTKAGYTSNPLASLGDANDQLGDFQVFPVDLTGMTVEAVKGWMGSSGLSRKDAARAKNMFALGLLSWMYGRPTETTIAFLGKRFAKVADIRDANIAAFKAGWNFGETTETFVVQYEVKPAPMAPGVYRNISGNLALAYGLVAGSVQSGLEIVLGTYPITPASDILHELSKHKAFGVTTFQAEDEIAGIGAAIGASFSGKLGHHLDVRPRHRAQVGGDRARGDDRAPAGRHRRAARRPFDRAARPRPSRPTCCRRCSAATARRRCRSWRRSRPATASTPPSRRSGSRSPTARR